MSRKSIGNKKGCALCGAKEVSEPRGEERYCRECCDKKIAVEEIVARDFALKRYIRAHSAEKYLVYHSAQKRPIGQIIVVDDGYDLFLTMTIYPNFAWDEPAYSLEGDPEGRTFAELPSVLMMNDPALNDWAPILNVSSAALIFTSFNL